MKGAEVQSCACGPEERSCPERVRVLPDEGSDRHTPRAADNEDTYARRRRDAHTLRLAGPTAYACRRPQPLVSYGATSFYKPSAYVHDLTRLALRQHVCCTPQGHRRHTPGGLLGLNVSSGKPVVSYIRAPMMEIWA